MSPDAAAPSSSTVEVTPACGLLSQRLRATFWALPQGETRARGRKLARKGLEGQRVQSALPELEKAVGRALPGWEDQGNAGGQRLPGEGGGFPGDSLQEAGRKGPKQPGRVLGAAEAKTTPTPPHPTPPLLPPQ